KIPIRVISDGMDYDFDFDPETNTAIFRIVQESLTNILRHAKATNIEVDIHTTQDRWVITVRDNGIGFDEDPALYGLGLLGMRERARALDAKLDLTSRPGFGTELRLSIPLACPIGTIDQPASQLHAHPVD
ncbi:MAG TPA: ATP-binding protein, partial [Bacteroidia bacterium]|nr:ATP-binding protein [Bacteroidia bacterium]